MTVHVSRTVPPDSDPSLYDTETVLAIATERAKKELRSKAEHAMRAALVRKMRPVVEDDLRKEIRPQVLHAMRRDIVSALPEDEK
ncbi:hypothetical protein KIPB_014021, partial [Kipferlia bialata]|eukprot:g14021.t1